MNQDHREIRNLVPANLIEGKKFLRGQGGAFDIARPIVKPQLAQKSMNAGKVAAEFDDGRAVGGG